MTDTTKVMAAAQQAAAARSALEDAIREARAAGVSLRDLAQAAGLSHETIRRICPK